MKRNQFLGLLTFLLAFVSAAQGKTGEELFYEANIRFAENQFSEALELYEQALETISTANLHHNAGVAARKLGDVGKARLHWERALALDPRHEKAQASLADLLAELGLMQSGSGFARWVNNLFSISQWTWITALSGWIFLFSIVAFYWKRKRWFFVPATVGLAGVMVAIAALASLHEVQQDGIVVVQEADLRIAPVPHSPVAGALQAGDRVRITKTRNEYLHIRRNDGIEGYLIETEIEPIF